MLSWLTDHVLGGSESGNETKVDWNDFNYPPLLSIVHFNPAEDLKSTNKGLWRAYVQALPKWLMLAVCCVNMVNNGVQVASGVFWPRILMSIFFLLIAFPLSFFLFYHGYKLYTCDVGSTWLFYGLSLFIWVVDWIYMISNILNADGWVRAADCRALDLAGCTVLSAVEGIVFFVLMVLRVAITVLVYKRA